MQLKIGLNQQKSDFFCIVVLHLCLIQITLDIIRPQGCPKCGSRANFGRRNDSVQALISSQQWQKFGQQTQKIRILKFYVFLLKGSCLYFVSLMIYNSYKYFIKKEKLKK